MKYLCITIVAVLLLAASPLRAQTPPPSPSTPSVNASGNRGGPNSNRQWNWSIDRGNPRRDREWPRDRYGRDDRGHLIPVFDIWLAPPQWRWWLRWHLFLTQNYGHAQGERHDRRARPDRRDRC